MLIIGNNYIKPERSQNIAPSLNNVEKRLDLNKAANSKQQIRINLNSSIWFK